jgi:hypothetical protein
MEEKQTYRDKLAQEFKDLIDSLDLDDRRKQFLQARWLDQVLWMEQEAQEANRWYYTLRLSAIVGGVIVPALVSLNVSGQAALWARWGVFVISLGVAISVTVEEFFRYGDRWRHYRQTVEILKNEGWRFFQLTGPYRRYPDHSQAYARFAEQVEEICQRDVQTYITKIVEEKSTPSNQAP